MTTKEEAPWLAIITSASRHQVAPQPHLHEDWPLSRATLSRLRMVLNRPFSLPQLLPSTLNHPPRLPCRPHPISPAVTPPPTFAKIRAGSLHIAPPSTSRSLGSLTAASSLPLAADRATTPASGLLRPSLAPARANSNSEKPWVATRLTLATRLQHQTPRSLRRHLRGARANSTTTRLT